MACPEPRTFSQGGWFELPASLLVFPSIQRGLRGRCPRLAGLRGGPAASSGTDVGLSGIENPTVCTVGQPLRTQQCPPPLDAARHSGRNLLPSSVPFSRQVTVGGALKERPSEKLWSSRQKSGPPLPFCYPDTRLELLSAVGSGQEESLWWPGEPPSVRISSGREAAVSLSALSLSRSSASQKGTFHSRLERDFRHSPHLDSPHLGQ